MKITFHRFYCIDCKAFIVKLQLQKIIDQVRLLSSHMPDAVIASMVANDGGYDPCKNGSRPGTN